MLKTDKKSVISSLKHIIRMIDKSTGITPHQYVIWKQIIYFISLSIKAYQLWAVKIIAYSTEKKLGNSTDLKPVFESL